jgi:ribosomal protein S18 acetylase RimI-like enzyme
VIRCWKELTEAEKASALPQIQEIFFITSVIQSFVSQSAKKDFWHKWTDYYFIHEPQNFLLFLLQGKVCGYLSGCEDSRRVPIEGSLAAFEDLIPKFPSHLHINLHPEFHGKRIGRALITQFVNALTKIKSPGVHIVTALDSRNTAFYRRNGFTVEHVRPLKNHQLLFMGRELS